MRKKGQEQIVPECAPHASSEQPPLPSAPPAEASLSPLAAEQMCSSLHPASRPIQNRSRGERCNNEDAVVMRINNVCTYAHNKSEKWTFTASVNLSKPASSMPLSTKLSVVMEELTCPHKSTQKKKRTQQTSKDQNSKKEQYRTKYAPPSGGRK